MSNPGEHPHGEPPFDGDINELRALWTNVQPRTGLGEDIEREDALTRASVSLLQEAWNSVSIPASYANKTIAPPPSTRTESTALPLRQWIALATAAALLLAAALGLRASAKTLRSLRTDVAHRNDAAETQSVAIGPYTENDGILNNSDISPGREPSRLSTRRDIQVEVTDDERLVLKSGPVRLYLAANSTPSISSITNSFDTHATETSQ